MTQAIYEHLAWLPRAPEDFNARCHEIAESSDDWSAGAAALAKFALDETQLNRLAKVIHRARETSRKCSTLTSYRLGIVSNASMEIIAPALTATAARHGILLDCRTSVTSDVFHVTSDLRADTFGEETDGIMLAIDYRGLPLQATLGDVESAEHTVQLVQSLLSTLIEQIRACSPSAIIVSTVARPPEALFGSLDLRVCGTLRSLIDAVNRAIVNIAIGQNITLLDVAGLAETVGLADWHDPVVWHLVRQPFATRFVAIYAEHVCRLVSAMIGRSRKVLTLDLDNTVWGGVIEEEGLEGIQIGEGDAVGEAHLSLQQAALMLRSRGVPLAISSKNDDETARNPFREHPGMALRESHICAFQSNWLDKATNLIAIAAELSLDPSALVFVDDNSFERGLVRELLPQVAVPELPQDPAYYTRTLMAAGYFEAVAFTAEDRARASLYQKRGAARAYGAQRSHEIEAYLQSLQMVLTIRPFDAIGRARIVQLINKSNQFNLTTRRYSEAQITRLQHDPMCSTFQVHLTDALGVHGMISVVICRREHHVWLIDTWLMSCRVLGRNIEALLLKELIDRGRELGIRTLVGEYRPSGRNKLVEQLYPTLGFTLSETRQDGSTIWLLDLAQRNCDPQACK